MNIIHLNFNKNIIMEIKTINNKTYVSTGRKDKHGNKIFEGDIDFNNTFDDIKNI